MSELCGGVEAIICQLYPALFLLLSPIPGSDRSDHTTLWFWAVDEPSGTKNSFG